MAKHHRVARLLAIVDLVKSDPNLRARDLAQRFEISEKRVYDDITDLSMAGVPIVFHQNGYRILPGYSSGEHLFDPEEVFRITLGMNLLVQQNVLDEATRERVMQKVFGAVSDLGEANFQQLTLRTRAGVQPENRISPMILDQLCAAISANHSARIHYDSVSSGKESEREVDPYFLTYKKNAWYLVAHCGQRKEVRTFKLTRIRKVESLERKFKPPPLDSLIREVDERWGIIGGKPEKVEVRFDRSVAPYIREKSIANSTLKNHRDGGLTLTVNVRGLDEFCWWVLQYGEHAEVLRPARLRDRMRRISRNMLEVYAEGGRTR